METTIVSTTIVSIFFSIILIFKGCRRCRRPRKGAAAAQGQIEGSSREYCNTLDFCQVGSKARGSSPFHNLFEAGWCLGHQMIKEVAWRGKGSGGGVQGLRFRGLTRTKKRKMAFFEGSGVGARASVPGG